MSLITGLFDSSLLQTLSIDSGGGLKKSERANTTRDQPRPGDEVGRDMGKGVRAKEPPLLDLRSSAIFPALTISCHSQPSDRLEQAILV